MVKKGCINKGVFHLYLGNFRTNLYLSTIKKPCEEKSKIDAKEKIYRGGNRGSKKVGLEKKWSL